MIAEPVLAEISIPLSAEINCRWRLARLSCLTFNYLKRARPARLTGLRFSVFLERGRLARLTCLRLKLRCL